MAIIGGPRPSRSGQNLGVMLAEAVKKPIEAYQKKEALSKEDVQIKKELNLDISGVTDPKLRHTMVAAKLQGANQQQLEQIKETARRLQAGKKSGMIKTMAADRGIDITDEQAELFAEDPSLFERFTKPVKEPKRTQASLPIDPEQLEAIEKVESDPEWESASIPQKNRMLQRGKVSKENSKSVIDPLIEEEKIKTEGKKSTAKTEAAQRKEEILFHQESEEYEKELAKGNKSAEHQLNAIKDVEKALKSKETSPTSLANVFSFFGKTGKKLADSILTGNQATIAASVPAFLEGRKELFGVRLSDADLAILEDKLPSMGKSKEANKAILKIMKKYSQGAQLRYKIGSDIKAKNKGLRPLGFNNFVEERYEEMTAPVRMRTPKGKIIEVPAYQVSDAISQGVTLENE